MSLTRPENYFLCYLLGNKNFVVIKTKTNFSFDFSNRLFLMTYQCIETLLGGQFVLTALAESIFEASPCPNLPSPKKTFQKVVKKKRTEVFVLRMIFHLQAY